MVNLKSIKNIKLYCFCFLSTLLYLLGGFSPIFEIFYCLFSMLFIIILPLNQSFCLFLFLHPFNLTSFPVEIIFNLILISFTISILIKYIIGVFKGKYKIYKKILFLTLGIYITSIITSFFYESYFLAFMTYLTYLPLIYLIFSMREEFNINECIKFMFIGLIVSCLISIFSFIPGFYFISITSDNRFRAFHTSPNYLYMRALFILSYYIFKYLNDNLKFWKFIIILSICTIITILTLSKTGIILLLFLYFLFMIFYIKKDFKKGLKFLLILIGIVLILSIIFYKKLFSILLRFTNISGDFTEILDSLFTGRIGIWECYLSAIFSSFWTALFGYGLFALEVYIPSQLIQRASHNLYLFILYRFGIIGTIALCVLIYFYIVECKNITPITSAFIPLIWFLIESFCDNTFKKYNFIYIILIFMILIFNSKNNKNLLENKNIKQLN